MASRNPNRASVGGLGLIENFVHRVSNDAFDRSESDQVIIPSEAKHFAQLVAHATRDAFLVRLNALERCIDKFPDRRHTHTALVVAHEHVLIAVDAHDDDAVIAQLVDIKIIATNPAPQCGDQRADFRRRQHLVKARLLDVEDLALERQYRLSAPIAALLSRAAG